MSARLAVLVRTTFGVFRAWIVDVRLSISRRILNGDRGNREFTRACTKRLLRSKQERQKRNDKCANCWHALTFQVEKA